MLPQANRMRRADEFRAAVRSGRRAGSATLVVHWTASRDEHAAHVGFVVSKAVGNAVTRHRVQRRLRHAIRARLPLPASSLIVVRALPAAARVEYAVIEADLTKCLARIDGARR